MSKVLSATATAGVVTAGGLTVDAEIQSEGVAESSGVLILDGPNAWYLAKVTPDIESTIEKTMDALEDLASVLNTIATTLTSIGAGMTGPTTAPPPTLAADVVTIALKATEITAIRAELATLKAALI